jgi:hypothetical protein
MLFVPSPDHGYRLIFDTSDTSIAFFQLLINVGFAALAGAIVANLSKRALYVIGVCLAVVAVGVGVLALKENAADRAGSDEKFADDLLKKPGHGKFDRVQMAQTHLHSAAYNWRLALRFGEAKRVEERADEVAKMSAADRSHINQGATPEIDLSDLPDQDDLGLEPVAPEKPKKQPGIRRGLARRNSYFCAGILIH